MAEFIYWSVFITVKVIAFSIKVVVYAIAVMVMVPYFIIMFIISLARKDDPHDILTRRPHPRAAGRTRIAPLMDDRSRSRA